MTFLMLLIGTESIHKVAKGYGAWYNTLNHSLTLNIQLSVNFNTPDNMEPVKLKGHAFGVYEL